tara:strand:- start:32890 stop:33726 length:837 start_codon:yes stop_codon:yes gene_type:complete
MKLSEETIPNEIINAAPRINLSRRQIICGLAAGTVVPIVTGCTTNPETGASQFLLVGEGQIAQMSASAWTEMKQQTPQTTNSALRSRVNRVWSKIAQGAGRANEQWDVAVFDTEDANAFVMPGNKVGVYRGITELTENDDQLASVLGHEVGHVAGRHAAERYSLAIAGQIAMVAGAVAVNQSDTLRDYGDAIGALGGAALQFGVLLPYSRRHELEADRLGVDYMYRSGYRVAEAPRLWDLMAEKSASRQPEFMSTHPDPVRRAVELRQYINAKGYDLV